MADALKAVDLSKDLAHNVWPPQELTDFISDAMVKTPGVIVYVNLAKRAKPFWAGSSPATDDDDDDLSFVKGLAKAFADAGKAASTDVKANCMSLAVWAGAFQVGVVSSVSPVVFASVPVLLSGLWFVGGGLRTTHFRSCAVPLRRCSAGVRRTPGEEAGHRHRSRVRPAR